MYSSLEASITEDKVVDFIIEKAKIVEDLQDSTQIDNEN